MDLQHGDIEPERRQHIWIQINLALGNIQFQVGVK